MQQFFTHDIFSAWASCFSAQKRIYMIILRSTFYVLRSTFYVLRSTYYILIYMVQFDEELQKKNLAELRVKEQENLAQRLSGKYGLPYTDLSLIPVNIDALKEVPEAEAPAARIASFKIAGKNISVATTTPDTEETMRALGALKERGFAVTLYISSERSLEAAWKRYEDVSLSLKTSAGILEIAHEKIEGFLAEIHTIQDVVRLVGGIVAGKQKYQTTELLELFIASALATDASDLHIEPEEAEVAVRFRLDGVLHKLVSFERRIYDLLSSRIKLLSGMKLNVHDTAQDGRFSIKLKEADVEVRCSAIPGAYGESIVLRILNPKAIRVSFENLGIEPRLLGVVEREIAKPNGMIISTGPTGSGKTTTLYAILHQLNSSSTKILTLEDPIEYKIKGINQTQVNIAAGLDFAKGLRSLLRQDPDIIMVGEIRDLETADTSINAALTGHLVLTTLHTNSAAGALPRFLAMGSKGFLLAPSINCLIGQRLVRRLCEHCKKPQQLSDAMHKQVTDAFAGIINRTDLGMEIDLSKPDTFQFYTATGCSECNDFGYRGRVGIFEI